jgi:hypothetical protein
MDFKGTIPNINWKNINESKLTEHKRYVAIEKPVETVDDVLKLDPNSYYIVKQKSQAWMLIRNMKSLDITHRFGASSLSNLLGFFTPAAKKHYKDTNWKSYTNDEFVDAMKISGKSSEKKFPEDIQVKLDWGTRKEANAIYYMLEKCINMNIYETGSYVLKVPNQKFEFLVSPDGIVEDTVTGFKGTLEVKAPCPFNWVKCDDLIKKKTVSVLCENCKTNAKCLNGYYEYRAKQPYKDLPVYYVAQTQFQMRAADKSMGLFVSYTPTKGVHIRLIQRNDDFIDLCIDAITWAFTRYVTNKQPIPTEKSPYDGYKKYGLLLDMAKILSTDCIGIETIENISSVEISTEPMWLDKKEMKRKGEVIDEPPKKKILEVIDLT